MKKRITALILAILMAVSTTVIVNADLVTSYYKDQYGYWLAGNSPYMYIVDFIDYEGTTTSVVIPTNLGKPVYSVTRTSESDKRGVFYYSNVTKIIIPANIVVGTCMCNGCSKVQEVYVGGGVPVNGSSDMPVSQKAFFGCTSLRSIYLGYGITRIGDYSFSQCSSLPSIVLPDSVTSIGKSAFKDCSSLASVIIPDNVVTIGSNAFEYCKALQSVSIPNGLTTINQNTFASCGSLASVTIPSSVTSIGSSAFKKCNALDTVYFTGTEEQWNAIEIGDYNSPLLNANIIFNYAESAVAYGDADGNGEIASKDVTLIRRYIAAYDEVTGTSTVEVAAGADVNGDGAINSKDVTLLRRYLASYDETTGTSDVTLGPQS